MNCIQKQQLVSFPKVRIWKPWFRHFNNHKEFHNEGTVHLFSLMALFSYANFRSNERMISGARYMEAPGQWICKLGSLPRILRVHSKRQALEQLDYYEKYGFLTMNGWIKRMRSFVFPSSIEFPTQLAVRIGGGAEWNRRVMYRAIREGYVRLYRKKHKRHVIRSMSLTQKGFEYVAQRDPEAVSMIYSRVNSSERIYPGWIDKILRLHAIAIGTVMSNAAGATLLISQKPSLMSPAKRATNAVVPDPNKIYYYAAHELRVAIEEYSPESVSKSSRTIGIIVKGRCCFFLYFTGSTRMYWMKNSEENYAAAVKSLLLARGFGITSIHQIVIGSTMSVAQRLCHGAKPFGNKYFIVSTFFAQCLFLTNNKEGDTLLKLILHDELAMEINRAALSPFHPPRIPTREYDAIETSLDRPVLLNYQCDLLMLSDIHPMPEGFRGSPIMLCFDYQTQVIQRIVGPAIEVRPLESRLDYG